MTRRAALLLLSAALAGAATRRAKKRPAPKRRAPGATPASHLPANRNVRWALDSGLWDRFRSVPFTDILDVMKDTGFPGIRLADFPRVLESRNIKATDLKRELLKRNCYVAAIRCGAPALDASNRDEFLADIRAAVAFLKEFNATRLTIAAPDRADAPDAFEAMCRSFNQAGKAAGTGIRVGIHNRLGSMIESESDIDRLLELTDPALVGFAPNTAHLHLAGCDVAGTIAKHRKRIAMLDYSDARKVGETLAGNLFDLGQGEIDFPACHRLLKSMDYHGWVCVEAGVAPQGPRAGLERSSAYVVGTLDKVYA
jgi:sugar phosphate isomerase/epimerase